MLLFNAGDKMKDGRVKRSDDRKCYDGEECIHQSQCQEFLNMKATFSKLVRNTRAWNKERERLKSYICDRAAKHICCATDDEEGQIISSTISLIS